MRVAVCLLALLSVSGLRASNTSVSAPAAAWDQIAARAAQAPATGYSHDRAALASRPMWQAYFRKFSDWKMPADSPPPAGKLRNLPDHPTQPRFPLTGKVWPGKHGEAAVCLWEDDKLAAASFSIDDNNAGDLDAWRTISKKYGGLNITWFLISGNIEGAMDSSRAARAGKWRTWQAVLDEGFQVHSHSVTHVGDPVFEDGWPGPDWECAESRRQIDAGLPGHRTKIFAPPGSAIREFDVSRHWHESMIKSYAAARGFSGIPINPANMIDYFDIRTTANPASLVSDLPQKDGFHLSDLFKEGSQYYRGWVTVFIHSINGDPNIEGSSNPMISVFAKVFEFYNKHREDLWIGHLGDVALYGQERDTATLVTDEAAPDKVAFTLTSKMDPGVFDYPLTVKVRLQDGWKTVKATQGGKDVPAQIVEHDGALFALVKAIPDAGQVVLARGS